MDSNLGEIIKSSLENINELAGTETVIGDTIMTPNGTAVIPVSKVSLGFASGGLDSTGNGKPATPPPAPQDDQKKTAPSGKAPHGFTGGGGTGVTVTPLAFLVIHPDGTVDLLTISPDGANRPSAVESLSSLIERSPAIIKKLKNVFTGDKKDNSDGKEAQYDSGDSEEKPL